MTNPLFWILLLATAALTLLGRHTLVSDEIYFNSLADQMTYDQIEQLIAGQKKWEWIAYVLVPLLLVIKLVLIALCLGTAWFLIHNRFELGRLFRIVVTAEFIFLIPGVIKLLWFLFIETDYTLRDLQGFYPLSASGLFDSGSLEPWLLYPLQVVNIFELLYWIALAWLITREFPETNLSGAMGLVASGYGTSLAVWIAVVMFITLTYS